jgi:phosphoglycolate phosphatase
MIAERGVDSRFQHVWGLGDLFAESKIDLGRRMLKAVGMNPATVLLVGDTVHDYEVARQLGCRVVLVAGGHQSERRLRACGCPIIDRIEALGENGAAARVETV